MENDMTTNTSTGVRLVGTTDKRVRQRLAAAALLAGTVGLGVGLVAPAGIAYARVEHCTSEATPGGILDVREFSVHYPGNDNNRLFIVEVWAAMPQSDAQKFIDRPGDEAILRLWGDDSSSDDLLSEFRPERYFATPEGLGMRGATTVNESAWDEDTFPDPAEADEWYTGIRLTDIRSGTEHKVETCRLNNTF
jgi:hypothetical protein